VADDAQQLPVLQVPAWATIPNLAHGFFSRRGGVSRGPFADLNLSERVGDASESVLENWRRVSNATGALRRVRLQQVHSDRVVIVNAADVDAGEADALVTSAPAIAVGVLTADCVPILVVAPQSHVVAAVHAGWRGTLAGVAEQTVRHIERAFGTPAGALHIALGPSIGGCCYEVDRSVADALEQRWNPLPGAVRKVAGPKAMVDLRHANASILERAGVPPAHIVSLGPCTRCAATEYFSYRSANGPTGRQWSFIAWRS
jgi:YfiH family protein